MANQNARRHKLFGQILRGVVFHALGSTAGWWHADVVCLTVGPRVLKRMPTSLGGARDLLAGLKRPRGAWLPGCAAGGDALLDMVFPHCYRSPGMGQLINGHPYLSRFGGIPQSTFMFFSFFVIQTTRQAR